MPYRQKPTWDIPDRLRKAREHAGMTQAQLAEASDIARATISNGERGLSIPHRKTIQKWAEATKVDFKWIMTGKN